MKIGLENLTQLFIQTTPWNIHELTINLKTMKPQRCWIVFLYKVLQNLESFKAFMVEIV